MPLKQLALFLLVTTIGYSQTISKQVIGTAGKTQSNSNLKVSWTTGEPVVGLMTAGGNQLGNGYYPALDIQALSVEDNVLDVQLRVYPNPTSSKIFITSKENVGTYEIYNTLGVLLSSTKLISENHRIEVDLSSYKPSLYHYKIH